MPKKNKFCQSCGMPLNLHGQNVQGTEKNGSYSLVYCRYCYEKGVFVEPNITYAEMIEKGRNAIKKGEGNPISKYVLASFYPYQLRGLDRWKK